MMFSTIKYSQYSERFNPVNVVVVQPNIDPYTEQYELDPMVVTERMLAMAAEKADSLTDFALFPESAIQEYIFEDQLEFSPGIARIRKFNNEYRQLNIITGISSRKIFDVGEPISASARKFSDADRYYDSYNTSLYVAHDGTLQKYHKSKLTPGVELMPYLDVMPFLKKFAVNLGGTTGSLGINPDPTAFFIHVKLEVILCILFETLFR